MRRAIILTEGSAQWGMGHLYRCAAFEEELILRHWKIGWRVCGDRFAQQFLKHRTGRLEKWWESSCLANELNDFHVAIVDSYHAPLSAYEIIAEHVSRCLYIDDDARLSYPKGYVLNSVPNAEKLPYVLGAETKLLAGSKYHALRSEFRDGYDRRIRDEVQNILIIMGGTDLRELSPLVAEQARCVYPGALIRVVVPIKLQHQKWSSLDAGNTKLLGAQDALEMRRLIEWADLCVSAAGQTLFELCRMGLPVVAVGIADNQRFLVDNLKAEKVILCAGWWNNSELAQDLREVLEQMKLSSVRKNLSQSGQVLVGGQGVTNCITQLLGA